MAEEIPVPGAEDEGSAELEGVPAETLLPMARFRGPPARRAVERAEQLQQRTRAETGGAIGRALLVDEERERDSELIAKRRRPGAPAEADRGDPGPESLDVILIVAQPGDLLAAEDSAVVAEEGHDARPRFPEDAEPYGPAGRVGEHDGSERRSGRCVHGVRLACAVTPARGVRREYVSVSSRPGA